MCAVRAAGRRLCGTLGGTAAAVAGREEALTLILTVNGPDTIWLLADRRLSAPGRRPKDDACKAMILETRDGCAILGYAGLGATIRGTEPATWMSKVLRGRNMTLEQSLSVLASAIQKQLPRHLQSMHRSVQPAHNVLIPAFLNDSARMYSIDLVFSPDRSKCWFRHTRHVVAAPNGEHTSRTPRIGIAGSGAAHLLNKKDWTRGLLRLVRACDRKQVSHQAVSDHMARISYRVSQHTRDGSVGPRCMVIWRNRKASLHKGGGGHQYYTGTTRDQSNPGLPTISNGMDLQALIGVLMKHMPQMLPRPGEVGMPTPEMDTEAINRDLAKLPETPAEDLE